MYIFDIFYILYMYLQSWFNDLLEQKHRAILVCVVITSRLNFCNIIFWLTLAASGQGILLAFHYSSDLSMTNMVEVSRLLSSKLVAFLLKCCRCALRYNSVSRSLKSYRGILLAFYYIVSPFLANLAARPLSLS